MRATPRAAGDPPVSSKTVNGGAAGRKADDYVRGLKDYAKGVGVRVAVGLVGPRRRCDGGCGRQGRSSSAASPAGEERVARGKDCKR
jgi:hypothetical protein